MRSPEFPPIITNFPKMLAAGQAAWMLTNTTTLPEEQRAVRERVEEAITNAGASQFYQLKAVLRLFLRN